MGTSYFSTVDYVNGEEHQCGQAVKMYKESDQLKYPNIVLSCKQLELYKVEAIKGILSKKSLLASEDSYALYIDFNDRLVEVGVIDANRLKIIVGNRLFDTFDKRAYLDKDSVVEGDMLFALCKVY